MAETTPNLAEPGLPQPSNERRTRLLAILNRIEALEAKILEIEEIDQVELHRTT